MTDNPLSYDDLEYMLAKYEPYSHSSITIDGELFISILRSSMRFSNERDIG